jgi:hypothetical protein
MNLTLTRPRSRVATLSPLTLATPGGFAEASGRGARSLPRACLGGEGSFSVKFMGPMRVHVMLGSWNQEP